MVTAGANQAYVNCILTLVGPGDQCIVFRPYYFNHVMAIQMTQGPDGLVIGDCNENGIPNLTWLEQTLSSNSTIKVVTLVNPGNPTGVYLEKSLVQRIVDVCGKYKVWLVLDSTYEHFCTNKNDQEDDNFPCWNEAHVIHIFSFSKGHSLAGYRCGYISVSKNAPLNVFDEMLKVQDTIPICASRIAQVAALGALQAGRSWVVEQVSSLTIGRQVILDALSPLNMTMGGSGAMYVMGKLPNGMDDQQAARKLVRDHGVAVIPGSFCGLPGYIRVCYSNLPPEQCKVAASRLAEGIKDLLLCNEQSTVD